MFGESCWGIKNPGYPREEQCGDEEEMEREHEREQARRDQDDYWRELEECQCGDPECPCYPYYRGRKKHDYDREPSDSRQREVDDRGPIDPDIPW